MVSLKETLRHKEAFELYYKQGNSRSLSKVSEVLKVGETTVRKWSVAFKWQERVSERDKEIAERVEERNLDEEVNTRVLLNRASNESIELYRKMLKKKDSIDIETVKVLDILGRLWKELEIDNKTNDEEEEIVGWGFDINGMPKAEQIERQKAGGIDEEKDD